MINRRVITVIKREFKEKLLSKAFIISTLLIPVFMFGILGLQTVFMSIEGDDGTNLLIVSESSEITSKLQTELADKDYVTEGKYLLTYKTVNEGSRDEIIKENKNDLLGESLTGVIYIPQDALEKKEIEYYSKNTSNISIFDNLRGPVNSILMNIYFQDKNLNEDDLVFAQRWVDFNGFKVSESDEIKEEGVGNRILSYLFTFLLYMSLLIFGSMMLRAVVEEKNNRIVEVLLSSLHAKELMTGKILGNTIVGLIQMTIWLLPVMVVISSTIFVLPPKFTIDLTMGHIGYLLFNFFVGLMTYLGLFATVGAIFDNEQDAQSGMWPIMLLIMIPFFMSFSMIKNPNNSMAMIGSMSPFASLIIMPARMTLVDVPAWQIITSMAVNIGTLSVIFPIAGKIYRVGILMTGKKPKLKEIIGWIKAKN
ncbi:MAG: sodium transporter [Melioribacteraceae bacterium]|nr:MAG: sodium transporter [Melioribacteraceae bacterium]